MKKAAVLVIVLIILSMFSCKSVDFKRIHTQVEEIETPVTETAEETEAVPSVTISPISREDEDLSSLTPLYENGELITKEEEASGEETESQDTGIVEEITSSPAGEESAAEEETQTMREKLPVFRLLMGLCAFLVILLIVLISLKASGAKGRKRKKPVHSDEKEEEKEFRYTFADEEYEVYLGSLDFSLLPSDDDSDDGDTEDTPDDPDTIISILKNE